MSGASDPIQAGPLLFSILAAAVFFCLLMALAWLVQRRTGRSGWADVAWTFGLGIAGAFLALVPLGDSANFSRQAMVATLAVVWALRLGVHILLRTLGGGEDPRYLQLAREWGPAFPQRLFWFLQLQAVCGLFLALSVLAAAHNPAPGLRWNDVLGLAVLAISIIGEGIGDAQLARFRADPAHHGRVCDTGLWALSRHPNYFFQWLGWVAYPIIAIDFTGSHGSHLWGWFAVTGPVFMYWLLVHVSGIPPLEAHMLRSRGDAFRAYQARVNAFFPGRPSKETAP